MVLQAELKTCVILILIMLLIAIFFVIRKKIKIVIGIAVFAVILLLRLAELGTTLYYINQIKEYSNDTWKGFQDKLSIDREIKKVIPIFQYYEKNDTEENGEN